MGSSDPSHEVKPEATSEIVSPSPRCPSGPFLETMRRGGRGGAGQGSPRGQGRACAGRAGHLGGDPGPGSPTPASSEPPVVPADDGEAPGTLGGRLL